MGLQYLSLVYSSLHYISPRYARIYSSKNIFCEFFLSKNESLLIEKVGKRTLSCLIYFPPPFSTFFLMRIEAKKKKRCLVELTFTLLGLVAPLEGKARRSKRKEAPTFCCWYTCASPSITRHIRTSIVCL